MPAQAVTLFTLVHAGDLEVAWDLCEGEGWAYPSMTMPSGTDAGGRGRGRGRRGDLPLDFRAGPGGYSASMLRRTAIQTLRVVVLLAFCFLIWLQVAAFADPVLPDPNANPGDAISQVGALWKSGAIPAAIIVAVFFVLSYLSKHVESLQKGKQAAVLAALLGGLAMLAERAIAGTTPNLSMSLSAVATAIALYVTPHTTPAS